MGSTHAGGVTTGNTMPAATRQAAGRSAGAAGGPRGRSRRAGRSRVRTGPGQNLIECRYCDAATTPILPEQSHFSRQMESPVYSHDHCMMRRPHPVQACQDHRCNIRRTGTGRTSIRQTSPGISGRAARQRRSSALTTNFPSAHSYHWPAAGRYFATLS
jgi:hypothetical protein